MAKSHERVPGRARAHPAPARIAAVSVLFLIGAVVIIVQHGQITRLNKRVDDLRERLDVHERDVPPEPPGALGGKLPAAEAGRVESVEALALRVRTLAATVDARFGIRSADAAVALLADLTAAGVSPRDAPARVPPLDVAALCLATDQPERALAWCAAAAAARVDATRIGTFRAAALMQSGRPQEAYAAIDSGSAAVPDAAGTLLRGQIELALGKRDEAEATLERALAFTEVAADAAAYLVPIALSRGEVGRAASIAARAKAASPYRYDVARLHAEVLLAQGQYDECVEAASMLVALDETDTAMLTVLGRAQLGAKRTAEAVATFEKLVLRIPEDADAHRDCGLSLLAALEPEKAARHFATAAELAPASAGNWYYLGVARSNADDCSAGIEALDRAIDLDPTQAHAWFARAVCLARLGSDAEAQQALQRALALDASLIERAAEVGAFERILAGVGDAQPPAGG